MKNKNLILALLSLLWISQCATTRVVRPLEKKQIKVSLDLGGPIIVLNKVPFPVPFSSAGFAYGIEDNLTGFASAYLTDALFGVIHMDLGATWGLLKPRGWIPGISVSPAIAFMVDTWKGNWKFYPTPDVNVYWDIKPGGDYIYLGLTSWFELSPAKPAPGSVPNYWIPSLNLGYTFVADKWLFTVEAKYMGFTSESKNVIINYVSPGNTGTLGLFLAAGRLF